MKVPLVKDTIDEKDISLLIDWLKTNPKLTKGEQTSIFEKEWSKYTGVKHSVYVNSGSSANLAMAQALKVSGKLKNNIIIAPAVSWVTTITPFIQLGYDVKLIDCDKDTLGPDIEHLKKMVIRYKPSAIIFVHVLGFPSKMKEILEICKENNIYLLEDSCESIGSTYNDVKTGAFGDMSSFSLYFGHHLSVLGDTPIPYINNKNEFRIDDIKYIYDNYSNSPSSIKIISFDKETHDIKYTSPYNMIKHKLNNKKLIEIKLKYNRRVVITEDHSVFSFINKKIIEKKGSDIKIGDEILIPSKLPRPIEQKKLRFIDYCKNIKNEFFVINHDLKDIEIHKYKWKTKEQRQKDNYKKRKVLPLEFLINETSDLKIATKKTPKYKYLPIEYDVTPELCRLIGYFLAEGSYGNSSICFSFNENELEFINDVKSIIKNIFYLNCGELIFDNGNTIKIYSKTLRIFFEKFLNIKSGASNKRVPSFIFSSSDECIISFLYGYFAGDGTKTDHNRISVSSVSEKLINDVSYLFSMLGYNGSIVNVKPSKGNIKEKIVKNRKTQYKFIISNIKINKNEITGNQFHLKNNINNQLSLIKVKEINEINTLDNDVYDFCVLNDENFIGGWQPICLHNSTIEGGMICTNDDYLYNILKSIRAHGWNRDLDEPFKSKLRNEYDVDEFKDLYTFYYSGFNLRSTDLQAFIGINQLNKVEEVVKIRNRNYNIYHENIKNDYWKINPTKESFVSNFAYPIITPKIKELVETLKQNEIETRPLVCGSILNQPFWTDMYNKYDDEYEMAEKVDKLGLYLPNNAGLTEEDVLYVCEAVNKNI